MRIDAETRQAIRDALTIAIRPTGGVIDHSLLDVAFDGAESGNPDCIAALRRICRGLRTVADATEEKRGRGDA